MAPGQVVQRGHSIIIASGAEIIPSCAIDHTRWNCSGRQRPGGRRRASAAPWSRAAPAAAGLLDLASNDYLGLCGDERLNAAAAEAGRVWGTGSTGSRLVTGTTELHAAARSGGALLVLDEAHAFGVTGPGGRGAAAAAGIAAEPDLIRTITLSKALAGQGGAVLGAPEVITTLVDTGRGFIFDTGLAPPCAGAALAALEVVAAEPGLGVRARAAAARLAAIAA